MADEIYDNHTIYFLSKPNPADEGILLEYLKEFDNNITVNVIKKYDQETGEYFSQGLGYIFTSKYQEILETKQHEFDDTTVYFSRAKLRFPEKKNVLFCKNISSGFSYDDALKIFAKHSNTPDYPVITYKRNQLYITFDPDNYDAEFALFMNKKVNHKNYIMNFILL